MGGSRRAEHPANRCGDDRHEQRRRVSQRIERAGLSETSMGPGERSCPPGFQVTCGRVRPRDDLRGPGPLRAGGESALAVRALSPLARCGNPVSSATWRQPCGKGGTRWPAERTYSRRTVSASPARLCTRAFGCPSSRMCEPASLVAGKQVTRIRLGKPPRRTQCE